MEEKEEFMPIYSQKCENLSKEEISNYLDLSQRVVHFNDLCDETTYLACKEYFKLSQERIKNGMNRHDRLFVFKSPSRFRIYYGSRFV